MRRPPRAAFAMAGLLAMLVVVATVVRACGRPERTIEVYADSALRHAFAELAEAYEDEHDVAVDLTVDSSGDLAVRLTDATAMPDVFAAADPIGLFQVNGILDGEPLVFAEDRLVIAVPRGNPGGIEEVADLRDEDVAVCFVNEACGRLAQLAIASAGIEVRHDVGADSGSTMDRVLDGAVDAGLVLASEADAAGDDVEVIALPWAGDRVSFPSISRIQDGPEPDAAQEFIDFVVDEMGQEILAAHGFASPDNPHLQPDD